MDAQRIIESAKEQLPEVKSRWELIERLAKQYNLSPNTINTVFCQQHFRTGFGNYFIGKKESEKLMLKFLEFVKERPRFVSEVKENFPAHTKYYRRLRVLNYPIQRMNITGKGSTKRKYDRTIYFTTDQNQRVEAYKRLIERFPLKTPSIILPVLDGQKEKIEEFKKEHENVGKMQRTFKAYFKMPNSNATVIISNTSKERLEPAIEELKAKGLILSGRIIPLNRKNRQGIYFLNPNTSRERENWKGISTLTMSISSR